MKKLNKSSLKKIAIMFGVFLLLLATNRASIFEKIYPFGISFAFALVANNVIPIVVCVEFFLSYVLFNLNIVGVVIGATFSAVLFIYYVTLKTSRNNKFYIAMIFCFLSFVARIYFSWSSLENIVFTFSESAIATILTYVFSKLVLGLSHRGIQGLTESDRLCLGVMFFAVGSGLSNLIVFGFDLSKFIIVLSVLLLSAFGGHSVLYSFMLCAGSIVYNFNFSNAIICFSVIILGQISQLSNKWLLSGFVCFIEGVITFATGANFVMFLPVLAATTIYAIIPQKNLQKLKTYVLGSNKNIIASYLLERKNLQTKNRLLTMSMMFQEMQNCYKNSIFLTQNTQKLINFLALDVKSKMCSNCINRLQCNEKKDIIQDIVFMLNRAQEKGKVTLVDVPNLIASNCNKLNSMLATINASAEEFRTKEKQDRQDAEEKLATGMQMAGTSEIFRALGSQFELNLEFNRKKSTLIKDKLTTMDIVCKECVAIEDSNGVNSVIMVVRNSDCVNTQITEACRAVYHTEFERKECKISKYAGWSIIIAQPKEHYEIMCGVASNPKEEGNQNGDNYIFTKISDSKYLVAICDGMGHGDEANNVSETAIKLIESYYKCGFDDALVASSVNQMLMPLSSTFSTLDVAVIDSFSGSVNFIKQGSAISVIKKQERSFAVDVESLPLGVDFNNLPTTRMSLLSAGDVVVLASDGVVDSFGEAQFCDFINNERALNMQFFAETILQEAASRQTNHRDDMTVVAIKIVQKR
ncbi:MAG: SpoIIE family protein phosphatase [Clostridia bacterium]|nr:SpoIIE family protein phosphatase [Clostridia bacterium]